MTERPPQWTEASARAFQQERVAAAYQARLPHPPAVFDLLLDLDRASDTDALLDAGTGDGCIARALAPRVARVDAVDFSAAMLAVAQTLPGGSHPRITWIEGRAETAPISPPYALVTCGESLHWMNWDVVMPRFAAALAPGGMLAVVSRSEIQPPWQDALQPLIEQYSVFKEFVPAGLVAILEERGLFQKLGQSVIPPLVHRQPVADYIASWHSRAGLAAGVMAETDLAAFDAALQELLHPYEENGHLELACGGNVTWGIPLQG